MTYEDIVDWSVDNYDPEDYDDFTDWVQAIKEDFANQDHYFPADTIESLREYWNDLEDNEPVTSKDIEPIRREAREDARTFTIESLRKEVKHKQKQLQKTRKRVTIIRKDRNLQKRVNRELRQEKRELTRENKKLLRENKKLKADKARLKRERRKQRNVR